MDKSVTVKTDVLIKVTSVVKEIVEYAEKQKIDLIIIAEGKLGLKRCYSVV